MCFWTFQTSQLPGRPGWPDLWDWDQTEADRRAGEQPAEAADAEAAVRGEAHPVAEQDQRHTAGERPRAAESQWVTLTFSASKNSQR